MRVRRVLVLTTVIMVLCAACSKNENQNNAVQTTQETADSADQGEQKEEAELSNANEEVTKDNFRSFPVSDESIFTVIETDDGVDIKSCKRDIQDKVIVVPETIGGKKVVGIGFGAFTEIGSVEAIVLPDSVERLGDGAFTGCENLKYVYLGTGLKCTGDATFNYCNALKEIDLPEGMTTMNGRIAGRCSGLEIITVPATVTEIKTGIISAHEFEGVIRTPAGSEAEKYAMEHGLNVENY